jgi:adenylylsulfate kinase
MAMSPAFVVWITGLPASGKSTITRALFRELAARRVHATVLESDAWRPVLTPNPTYSDEERDAFYGLLSLIAVLLASRGVPTIVDATANRRRYRDQARAVIGRFVEVFVDCPLEVCIARDPKGLYRKAREGGSNTMPGSQASYEPPESPDLVVHGDTDTPEAAARRILALLEERGYIHTAAPSELGLGA